MDFLIDGYNLLHFAGLARERYGPGDLERARNRLLKRLQQSLTETERARTTIVFDHRDARGTIRPRSRRHGMEVLFSAAAEEADDVIEALIKAHSAPKQLLVVSSDHRLQRAARARRARTSDSEDFLQHLESRTDSQGTGGAMQQADTKHDRSSELSTEELQEWLTVFGEIDPERLAKDAQGRLKRQQGQAAPSPSQPSSRQDDSVRSVSGSSDAPVPFTDPESLIEEDEARFWQKRIDELQDEDGPHEDTIGFEREGE